MMIKNHILVVGDDRLRAAMPSNFFAADTMVSAVSNMDDARCFLEHRKVDMIVADMALSDGRGTELINIQGRSESCQLLIVGDAHDEADKVVEAGAEFLVKTEQSLQQLPRIVEARARDWGATLARHQTSQHREHLLAILDAIPDFVGTTDIDGFFLHLNCHGRKMMGLNETESVSRLRLFDIHDTQSAATIIGLGLPRAIKEGVWRGETNLLPLKGNPIPVSQVLIGHKDGRDNVTHFSTILHDLTQVKAAEEYRKKLVDDLHQVTKMESIGRLAGGMAHDLNNRLTAIIGYAELGLMADENDKTAKYELQMVIQSCEKASKLIEQLVTYSRKQAVSPRTINVNEVVAATCRMLSSALGAHIKLEADLDPELWPVIFDSSQLDQAIVTLATNRRKSITGDGEITFKTCNTTVDGRKAQELGLKKAGDFIVLSMLDSGCRIDDKHRKHIFEPFYTTSVHDRDDGLGLPAVYGAILQNNGAITIGDSESGGNRFDIYLPRDRSGSES